MWIEYKCHVKYAPWQGHFQTETKHDINAQDYNTDYINASSSIDRLKYVCTKKTCLHFCDISYFVFYLVCLKMCLHNNIKT